MEAPGQSGNPFNKCATEYVGTCDINLLLVPQYSKCSGTVFNVEWFPGVSWHAPALWPPGSGEI